MRLGEIAESSIGSEWPLTNEPTSDWTKPPTGLSELEVLNVCRNYSTALLQGKQEFVFL